MYTHDIVVVGASAGGVEALQELVRALPSGLPAAVLAVLHVPEGGISLLPHILSRAGPLPAVHAVDRAAIQPGRIYVAPPDFHLLVKDGRIAVVPGPKENGHRPAIDPLFRSAAVSFGPRVVGVVLSGTLDDGVSGLHAIKKRGGTAIVQDPREAAYASMPSHALEEVRGVDYVQPVAEIAATISRLAREPVARPAKPVPAHGNPHPNEEERDVEGDRQPAGDDPRVDGHSSVFSCPECGGVLWELDESGVLQFRCRVGHAYSPKALLSSQAAGVEDALWTAMRALREKADLLRRLSERMRAMGNSRSAESFASQASEAEIRAAVVRDFLTTEIGHTDVTGRRPEGA